jgi:hypothetical protein
MDLPLCEDKEMVGRAHPTFYLKNKTKTTLIQAAMAATAAQKQDRFANSQDSLAETHAFSIIFVCRKVCIPLVILNTFFAYCFPTCEVDSNPYPVAICIVSWLVPENLRLEYFE